MTNLPMLISPDIFMPFGQVKVAQSTRHGGVSPAPFHSLNLGKSTADDPVNVAENRRRVCDALGFEVAQMAWSKQVHGDNILQVTQPGGAEGFDALVTDVPGILLAVSVADCTPVLIFDRRQNAVAAIHAGWRGTVAGIVGKTLHCMKNAFGSNAADCFAYIGACIDVCSFEVGDEVAEVFDPLFKQYDAARGKFFVDLKKANAAQLLAFGIPENQIEQSPYCTLRDHAHIFSHRKEQGVTGRGMGLIGVG